MHESPAVKKVVVIGPECTGKSALSAFLAKHYNTSCVDEYAREFLDNLGRPYQQADLIEIARGQVHLEDSRAGIANRVVICDTNAIVVKVWSDYKYGSCDPLILRMIRDRHYDHYLLTYIDIPWHEDPYREHPDKRELFWDIFLKEVAATGVPFTEIRGSREQRQTLAISIIDQLVR